MSTLTYPEHDYAGEATATLRGPARKGLWRRAYEGILRSQQRRAEREIAAYLESHGGLFTDDMEREIMQRLEGRRGAL
jgi:hypothetical protein